MVDIVSIVFSLVALVCGVITLYWLLRLKNELPSQTKSTYVTSALIAISFLVSFPLWNLFLDMFTSASTLMKQISYLFFSAGYFGVLLVAHLSLKGVVEMKSQHVGLKVKKTKKIAEWAKKKE